MPLLDHFHPPLFPVRHWEAFHAQWATSIAAQLNQDLLPEGYFAESQVHVGGRVEVDVGAFEEDREPAREYATAGSSALATESRAWVAPPPAMTMGATFPDAVETLVYSAGDRTLVAALELVSPGNKDRPETRAAFVGKCATYLCDGIGLAILDVVTRLRANLHNELVASLGQGESFAIDPLGRELPILPLAIRPDLTLPLDLEAAYRDACRRSGFVG